MQRRLSWLAVLLFASGPAYGSLFASPNPNTGSYTVEWAGGADTYTLYETFEGSTTQYSWVHPTTFEKSFSGKAVGFYSYRLHACTFGPTPFDPANCGDVGDPITVRVRPRVPTGLTAPSTDSNGAYTVSWAAVSGATTYQLQERFNSGSWALVHSGSATSKARSGRSAGSWTYRVRACAGSTNCSGWSGTRTVNVPPPIPTGLNAPATDHNGDYTISWNAASGAATYQLHERKGSGSWAQIHNSAGISRAVADRTAGVYSYRVRSCNSICSSWSATRSVTVAAAPTTPTGLTSPATDYNGSYTISWSTSSGSSSYRLEERLGSGSWVQIHSGSTTAKAVTGNSAGDWSYRVRGCNPEVCSGWSGTRTTTVPSAPATPGGLTGPGTDYNGSYTISWGAASRATTYQLQERLGSGAWSQIHSGSALSSAVSGNAAGTYGYRVRGCAPESVCGSWSTTLSVVVKPPPSVPAGLSGPATDHNGSYTVSWSTATGATSYQLQERLGSGSWAGIHAGSATSKAVSGNSAGTYGYRVRGCGPESVCGSWSSAISVTVVPPPAAPAGLTGPTTDYNGAYTISWSASSGASTYRLEERLGSGAWGQIHSGGATSKAVSGHSAGSWSYRVSACNVESVCGAWSATHTVTVAASPATPTGLTGPAESPSGNYTVSWNASSGSSSYRLEEREGSGAWNQVYSGSSTSKAFSGQPIGSYAYRVSGCNPESVCSSWSSTLTVEVPTTLEPPVAPPPPAPFPDPGQASAAESDTIGSTAGNFRVDESGAATYSIPIATTAGTAGVAPQISLNYSSGSGNNIAGMGWSIGGLSAISRCRQTYDQDRNVSSISFDQNDRFCLDGQRLLLVSGSSYGASGSVYRAEIDGGAIVTAVGSTSGEPDYFEVKRKDGSTSYYGKAPDNADVSAKLGDGAGRTLTWAIRQFKDSVGNSIWFDYDTANGGQRISAIKWAYGMSTDPVNGYGARLQFNYEARVDAKSGYVDGALFQNDKRLASISSYNRIGSSEYLIRQYFLRYNEGVSAAYNKVSRLTSIQECVGSACLPKTTFDWRVPVPATISTVTTFSMGGSDFATFAPADINGDGRMDLVWVEGQASPWTLRYALSNGTSYSTQTFSNGSTGLSISTTGGTSPPRLQPLDYNLDGRQDIVYPTSSGSKVLLSKPVDGSDWRLSASPIPAGIPAAGMLIDVDSNGTVDALYGGPNYGGPNYDRLWLHRLERDPGQPDSSPHAYAYDATGVAAISNVGLIGWIRGVSADFNGDGQIDVVMGGREERCGATGCQGGEITFPLPDCEDNPNCQVLEAYRALVFDGFSGSSPTVSVYHEFPDPVLTAANGSPIRHVPELTELQVIDVNGDGLSDVFYPLRPYNQFNERTEYRLGVNQGDGTFIYHAVPDSSLTEDGANPRFADWNMDGHPDLLWRDTGGGFVRVRYWDPQSAGLVTAGIVTSAVSTSPEEQVSFFDVNGDAVPEIVRINADGTVGQVTVLTRKADGSVAYVGVNRIESITNGLGATTSISYEPLSYTAHYERLEVATTTSTETHCEPVPIGSGGTFCYDEQVEVADEGAFYTAINGDWGYPTTWQYLPKSSPIIEMSGPLYVVTRVTGDAPVMGNVNARSSIEYHYGEAKIQAAGRGFLGFQRLTTTDEQSGVKTTTRYRQDWPFIGRPISTIVTAPSGQTLSLSTTEWSIKEWSSSTEQTAAASGTAILGPLHVVQSGNKEETYDLASGSLLSTVETATQYDTEGNVTSIAVTTENGAGQVVKTVQTVNAYDASFPLSLGRLSSATVTTTLTGDATPLVRKSAFTYYSAPGEETYGLLHTETIEPDNPAFTMVTEHFYDDRGNRNKSTVTGGGVTRCNAVTATFDMRFRYIDTTRDCLGRKTSQVTSRSPHGTPTTIETYVDAAGASVTTQIAYSTMGREYYRSTETGAGQTQYLTANVMNCPAGTAYKSMQTSADGSASQECFDVLGRITRSLTLGFDGQWDGVDTEYDFSGRVKRKSEPFDLAAGPAFWTTFGYDLLGRVTLIDRPDNSSAVTTYAGLITTQTVHADAGTRTRREERNVLGEIVSVTDNLLGVTRYQYDEQGNLIQIKDPAGNIVTEMKYDLLGRKFESIDLDKGTWTYHYNHFGELEQQTDANGNVVTMTYDGLGRIKTRRDSATASGTVWTYDTAPNGLGQLDHVQDMDTGFMRAVLYDAFGRPSETITNFDGGIYYEKTTYDQFGRVFQVFDAAGDGSYTSDGVVHRYNAYGYPESIGSAVRFGSEPRTVYRRIVAMNARGQITVEERGIDNQQGGLPSVTTTYGYWAASGRLHTVDGVNQLGYDVQNLQYAWDELGNLTSREDLSGPKNLTENFYYDSLNRLDYATVAGQPMRDVTYDAIGNITFKTGVGNYTYDPNRPHVLLSAGSATYSYDANGNNLTGDGRTLRYTPFNKPWEITKGGHTTRFAYGPDRARYRRVDQGSAGTTTTRYIGNVEIIFHPDGTQERKRYIAGVAVESRTITGGVESGRTTHYLYKDHLGSLDVATTADGTVYQWFSFDAWGQRRDATDWTALPPQDLIAFDHSLTTRGFTGHEMLDEVGLIHMNGRIYDPKLGRFLQADPYIQDATNAQSLNRYSYVWNNPLNATDPSGHFLGFLIAGAIFGKIAHELDIPILSSIASIAICASTAGLGCATTFAFGSTIGAGGSFSDAFKNGLFAGLSAAAFSGIAEAFDGTGFWASGGAGHIGAHALAGGVLSELQGGKFGHGFLSAGLTKAINLNKLMPGSSRQLDIQRTIVAGVVGGTISEVSGGKFANGAITAAFAQAYNGNQQAAAEAKKRAYEEWLKSSVFNVDNLTAMMGDFSEQYPLEYAIFVEYAHGLDLPPWTSDDFYTHYERAWMDFSPYLKDRSWEIFNDSAASLQIDLIGPTNLGGSILKAFGFRTVAESLGAIGKARKIITGGNVIDMTTEVMNIRIYGPQVINEDLYRELHGSGYGGR